MGDELMKPQAGEGREAFVTRCVADAGMQAQYADADTRRRACELIYDQPAAGGGGSDSDAAGGAPSGVGAGPASLKKATRQQGNKATSSQSAILKVGGVPAAEFRLLPFGRVGVDAAISGGDFDFTRAHAAQAVHWFGSIGRKLAIDYEHQSMDGLNQRDDGLVPAAGWIGGLEIRADGLWCTQVEWTDKARSLIASGEYAYFSPVIYWTDEQYSGVKSLGPVALTNDPALKRAPALVASRLRGQPIVISRRAEAARQSRKTVMAAMKGGPRMDQIKELLGLSAEASLEDVLAAVSAENQVQVAEALGLPAEATLDEIKAALRELATPASEETAGEEVVTAARRQTVATIARRLQLDGVTDVDGLVAAVAKKDAVASASVLTRVAELERRNADLEFDQLVTVGAGKGKITPTVAETARKLFHADRTLFDEWLDKLPVLASNTSVLTGKADAVPADGTADNEEGWKAAFKKSADLQQEFGSEATFIAFKQNEYAGRVTIAKGK